MTWRAPRLSCASTASLSYSVLPAAAESLCVGALETWSWACSSAAGALGGADGGVEFSSGALSAVDLSPADLSLEAASAGRQSEPLRTVPSGQVPGDSACLVCPPHEDSASVHHAPAARPAQPAPSLIMMVIIAPIGQRAVSDAWAAVCDVWAAVCSIGRGLQCVGEARKEGLRGPLSCNP